MGFLKNSKTLNLVCKIICISYIFFVFGYLISTAINEKMSNDYYNNLITRADLVNQSISDAINNSTNNNDNNTEKEVPFINQSNAKEYVISAFNNLLSANSYNIKLTGSFKVEKYVLGGDYRLNFLVEDTAVKLNSNLYYNELILKCVGGDFPSSFAGKVNQYCMYGCKALKYNNSTSDFISRDVSRNGDKLTANYSSTQNNNSSRVLLADNIINVNSSTIKSISYVKCKYQKNKIKNYYINIELDAQKAYSKTRDVFKVQLEKFTFNPPEFLTTRLTAMLDSKGNLVSFSTIDSAYENMSSPIGYLNALCNFNIKYTISSVNEKIDENLYKKDFKLN